MAKRTASREELREQFQKLLAEASAVERQLSQMEGGSPPPSPFEASLTPPTPPEPVEEAQQQEAPKATHVAHQGAKVPRVGATPSSKEPSSQTPAGKPSPDHSQYKLGGGRPAGSGGDVPEKRNWNRTKWVDHAAVCASKIRPSHTREDLAFVAKAMWGMAQETDPDMVKGVVVQETHADGSLHLQGAVLCGLYFTPARVNRQALAADLERRGWKTEPEMEEVTIKRGGKGKGRTEKVLKPKKGSGERFHFNLLFNHVYGEDTHNKPAGSFKSHWPYNAMVDYLLAPVKNKEVDATPLFINCSRETVYYEEEQAPSMSLHELLDKAKQMKADGADRNDLFTYAAQFISKGNSWMWQPMKQAYDAAPSPNVCTFLPRSMEKGSLEEADPFQIYCCTCVERGPVSEGEAYWIQVHAGGGAIRFVSLCLQ